MLQCVSPAVSFQRTSNAIFAKAAFALPACLWSMATCIDETVSLSNDQEKIAENT